MELKRLVTIVMTTLIATILFLTCMFFLFSAEDGGIFKRVGDSAVAKNFGDTNTDSKETISTIQNTQVPEVKYNERTYSTGEEVGIKSLLLVKTYGSSEFVSGETENGFAIVVMDVMDAEGNTINPVSEEEGEESEEIVSKAYYNQREGTIIFNEKGVFRIGIRVYGDNGRYVKKEIKVPVED